MKGEKLEVLNSTRFGMFAAAHILWSLLCAFFVWRFLGGNMAAAIVNSMVMMLGYALWGWLIARFCHWPRPTKAQGRWAVLAPALIAWAWAGTTAVCLYSSGDKLIGLGAVLGLPAMLLASPSLLFVMTFAGWVNGLLKELAGHYGGAPGLVMAAAIFFAGLLPPLLFHLGGLLASKRNEEKKDPETA